MVLKDLRKQMFNYFLILGIIITLIFSMIAYAYIKGHIITNAENELKLYASLASQIIEQKNEVLFTYLEGVESCLVDEYSENDIESAMIYLKNISESNEHFRMIGIADDNGKLYYPSLNGNEYIVLDVSNREYYKDAMNGKRSIMSPSKTINPELKEEIVVAYALPIYKNKQVKGALVAIANSDFLYNQIKDIKFGKSGYAYMIDFSGQTIAHPDILYIDPKFNVLKEGENNDRYYSVSQHILEAMKYDSGVGHYEFDKEEVYSGYAKVKGINWIVFIIAFKYEVLTLLYPLIVGIVILNIAIIFSGIFIYRKIRIEILKKDKELTAQRNSLEYEAAYDELTKVYNRRYGLIILNDRLKLARRMKDDFTIAYIDIDNLKITNDRIGHIEGDRFIKTISDVFVDNLRKSDFIARLGGDEFLVGFYNCDFQNAEKILEKVERDLEAKFFELGFEFPLLFSYGLVTYNDELHGSLEELIEEADQRMYIQKKSKKEY